MNDLMFELPNHRGENIKITRKMAADKLNRSKLLVS